MTESEIYKFLTEYLPDASPWIGLGVAYWVKKWIERVDKTLSALFKITNQLNKNDAVKTEQHKNTNKNLDSLKSDVKTTQRDLQDLRNSMDRVWVILEHNNQIVIPPNIDDSN